MRLAVLGSGSSGNSAVVEIGGVRLLVDAGLSAKQLTDRAKGLGIDLKSIDGILLTHEHGDHIRGLRVLLKQAPVPVYATAATAHVVRETGIANATWKIFEAGQTFRIGEVEIEAFAIQHDAVDPVGFVMAHATYRLGLLSDAGFVTRGMVERLRGVHGLFVEANYDDALLEADTKRPWSTKQRISSRHGHLSNAQAAELVAELAHPGLRRVVLGHLSRDCNTPDVAKGAMRRRSKSTALARMLRLGGRGCSTSIPACELDGGACLKALRHKQECLCYLGISTCKATVSLFAFTGSAPRGSRK
jgi:phosphoribosyl 1,2-cyclic phosphodiesterase